MALTVEDGSVVAGADSFVSVDDARAYATKRGVTLPAAAADVEVLLIKAKDYLEALEPRFVGSLVDASQPLAWPRSGVYYRGFLQADDAVPQPIVDAQVLLAIEAQTTDLQPTGDGREVLKEKVDVIEVQYAERGVTTALPRFTAVMNLLAPFLDPSKSSATVVRV